MTWLVVGRRRFVGGVGYEGIKGLERMGEGEKGRIELEIISLYFTCDYLDCWNAWMVVVVCCSWDVGGCFIGEF